MIDLELQDTREILINRLLLCKMNAIQQLLGHQEVMSALGEE